MKLLKTFLYIDKLEHTLLASCLVMSLEASYLVHDAATVLVKKT